MKENLLTMSKQELTRLEVMKKLEEKRMKQNEAGDVLGLSVLLLLRSQGSPGP